MKLWKKIVKKPKNYVKREKMYGKIQLIVFLLENISVIPFLGHISNLGLTDIVSLICV